MAITAKDIETQSFSIDRKGYDVDEVDVFLERVSTEVEAMNNQIAELQSRLETAVARAEAAEKGLGGSAGDAADSYAAGGSAYDLREKDRRIAELERQLDERNADANAIAQALIIAQRSGDEIIANAKKAALNTQQDAEEEAKRILDKANGEKQRVMNNIAELQSDRETVRASYQELLRNFISDASQKLTEIGGEMPVAMPAAYAAAIAEEAPVATSIPAAPDPLETFAATYTTPRTGSHGVTPAAPKVSTAAKDLSGFGETDDSFGFDDID